MLSRRTKNLIRRRLLAGESSRRAIAREAKVGNETVLRMARELGVPDVGRAMRKTPKRCTKCGAPWIAGQRTCPHCAKEFRSEIERRRREFDRRMQRDP